MIFEDSDEVTLAKVDSLNGVLYPGGAGDYYGIGKKVMDKIMQTNDAG